MLRGRNLRTNINLFNISAESGRDVKLPNHCSPSLFAQLNPLHSGKFTEVLVELIVKLASPSEGRCTESTSCEHQCTDVCTISDK